jgi:LytR cell envelope-related transcriptional attenuator/Tetratricopeptide repeat
MSRVGLLLLSASVLAGCSTFSASNDNLWVLLEKSSQSQPKLTAYEQAKRYLAIGDIGLAVESFQRELADHPNSVPALNGIAIAFDRLGRGDVAQKFLDRALSVEPDSAITLNNLAYLNLAQGNAAVAAAYGDRAKEAAADPGMHLAPSVASAVSTNAAIANSFAMSDAPPELKTQSAPEGSPAVERVSANEWQLHLPQVVAPRIEVSAPVLAPPPTPQKKAEWRGEVPEGTILRVSNGTGRRLMATRFAAYLGTHGLTVSRVENANSYTYNETTIFYNPDQEEFATKLAEVLPFPTKMAEAIHNTKHVEIILAADLLNFDDTLKKN